MHERSKLARRLASGTALLGLVLSGLAVAGPSSAAPPATPGSPHDERVLVFTNGADEATSAGVSTIEKIGRQNQLAVDVTDDAAAFSAENLSRYEAVIFLNTAGDNLNDGQQSAFESYFRDGGGFVGVHSAIEAEPEWQFMTDILGTRAAGVSGVQPATIEVADNVHPASTPLDQYWEVTDRWYDFTDNVRGVSHVLATLDEDTYEGGAMGFDHPISWCKDFEGGRSFYTGRGGTADAFSENRVRKHLTGAIEWAAGGEGDCGATVLANYEMTIIATQPNVGEPMAIAVLPDGRVMQTTRDGEVRLHQGDGSGTEVIAHFDVYSHSEDGLYGPVLDPDFDENDWVYFYYAPPLETPSGNAPVTSADPAVWDAYEGYFQLSRFKFVDGDEPTIDMASEQQILQVPVDRGACCHVAGDIVFDSAGNLILSTGDDTNAGGSGGFSPINDMAPPDSEVYQAPAYDARRSAGNTNDLRGKLLRITVQPDGSYTIPDGNLFAPGTPQTRPEIYAMGLRNPFRINIDSDDKVYVADYSPDSRNADPERGPEGTGRMMIIDEPSNYGWPFCMQPDLPYIEYDFATDVSGEPFDCNAPTNDSRHNTGLTTLPAVEESELWYTYQDKTPCAAAYLQDPREDCPFLFPGLETGGVGPHGAVPYEYDKHLDSETKFPEYYDGAIFFSEFTRDYQKEIRLDKQGNVFQINSLLNCGDFNDWPDENPFLCDDPMDVMFGPDGHYYILMYGDGFFGANDDAALVKFAYAKGTRAPNAVLSANQTDGPAPLTVEFSSAGTNDPDPGDAIEYAWDFDGDGTTDSTEEHPTHTYTELGQFVAALTVTDSNGQTGSANTTITVGNTAPNVEITVPVKGGLFEFGDAIPYEVEVSDPEDGPIDCDQVEVTFLLGHDDHAHAGATQTGCSGVYQTEASDADHAGGHVFGVFNASYTDLGGPGGVPALTTVDAVPFEQKHQEVEFRAEHSSTNVQPTNDPEGGGEHLGSLNNGSWIKLNGSYDLVNIDTITFRVANDDDDITPGGPLAAVEVHLDSVDGPILDTFALTGTASEADWESQTFPISDPGGLHDIYLVFRTVPGGSGGSSVFNLNWVEFGGQGVGTP